MGYFMISAYSVTLKISASIPKSAITLRVTASSFLQFAQPEPSTLIVSIITSRIFKVLYMFEPKKKPELGHLKSTRRYISDRDSAHLSLTGAHWFSPARPELH